MKTALLISSLVFVASATSAQKIKEAQVPKAVLASFNNNFKGAKAASWEKEKNGFYEAEFKLNKNETSASFNPDGVLFETETEIAIKMLPQTITAYIEKNYRGYKIAEASQITTPSGSQTFEAEIKKGNDEFDLIFDANGNFLSKKVNTQGDQD